MFNYMIHDFIQNTAWTLCDQELQANCPTSSHFMCAGHRRPIIDAIGFQLHHEVDMGEDSRSFPNRVFHTELEVVQAFFYLVHDNKLVGIHAADTVS